MVEPATIDLTEAAGFGAFYADALPRVYGYFLCRCGGDRALAEDLTQETFMAGVRELHRGSSISAPTAWILGIARHKLVDHYRRHEREQRKLEAIGGAAETDVSLEWGNEECRQLAIEALSVVAAPQRAALVLHYLDGFPVAEVAGMLGKSEHAIESLLARGRQSFRRAYQEALDA
ncbi:MAG TPA: RNA polymerase sigma factor [Actinomycetota bacterium]|nr:RNA polymerase sigma factor [Actinomycetota bacterium]